MHERARLSAKKLSYKVPIILLRSARERRRLIVAPCLGGIHLTLLFITDGLTTGKFPPSQYPAIIFQLLVLSSVPFLVMTALLYNKSRGSLLLIALFHSSLDATNGTPLLSKLTYYEFFGAFAVVVMLLILLTRGRLAYQPIPDLQSVQAAEVSLGDRRRANHLSIWPPASSSPPASCSFVAISSSTGGALGNSVGCALRHSSQIAANRD